MNLTVSETCANTLQDSGVLDHTPFLHSLTEALTAATCWFPATPTFPFSISMAVVRQPASEEVLWVELKKLYAGYCL